ncbi:MAG: bifunctional riboflavin kinase/FAD synthetase [Steroidobacteraceae bacterium]
MRLQRRLDPPGPADAGFVATIGGFDGIHLGHQTLVQRVRSQAEELRLESLLLSFEPLPREYFTPGAPPGRLTTFRERWRLLSALGIDVFCVLRFCDALRNQTADEFAAALARAGIRRVLVGHDFRAGKGAKGDVDFLRAAGRRLGFEVEVLEPVCATGERISSRGLRAALQAGDLVTAQRWLGRRYSMRGRVIRGEQLGRTLGYPTANLRLERRCSPLDGIFAVRVKGVGAGRIDAVASLGTRPTVGGTVPLLEVHLFDFSGDLYGRELEVEFVARLREERRFEALADLVVQMDRDAAEARAALAADAD